MEDAGYKRLTGVPSLTHRYFILKSRLPPTVNNLEFRLQEAAEDLREEHNGGSMASSHHEPTAEVETSSTVPVCRNCGTHLVHGADTLKKDGTFMRNCKSCRDVASAKRRKRKMANNYAPFSILCSNSKKRKVAPPPTKEPTPQPADPECTICADTFPTKDLTSLSECTHEPDVCHECFLSWLTQQMESTACDRIACPSTNCSKTLSHDDVKSNAPADVFARYIVTFYFLAR
jgi:hypothetical protein